MPDAGCLCSPYFCQLASPPARTANIDSALAGTESEIVSCALKIVNCHLTQGAWKPGKKTAVIKYYYTFSNHYGLLPVLMPSNNDGTWY